MRGPAVEQSVLASQRVRDTWAQYNPTAVPGTSMQVQPPSSSAAAAGTSKAAAAAASGNGSGSGGGSGSGRPQRPVQGDCPICFDDMDPGRRLRLDLPNISIHVDMGHTVHCFNISAIIRVAIWQGKVGGRSQVEVACRGTCFAYSAAAAAYSK